MMRHVISDEPLRVSELNRRAKLNRKTVSIELGVLSELGFLVSEKKGQAKYFRLSDTKHARLLRNMIAHSPQLRYEDLLAGKSLDVLSAIHLLRLDSIKGIEEFSQTSHVKVIELLGRYKELGAVRKSQGGYGLGARYRMLGDFLAEFRSYTNLKIIRNQVPDAVVVWERDRDVLFRSSEGTAKSSQPSAFSAFPRFGVDVFVGDTDYYFYSSRHVEIGVEEALVHAMLAAEGPRERTLILILLLKGRINEERLLSLSRVYGAEETARDYLEYARTKGGHRPEGFPEWGELTRRLREYA